MRYSNTRFFAAIAIILCAGPVFGAPFVMAREGACAAAPPLTAGTVTYLNGLDSGTTALFAVEVSAPARLTVEIAVSGLEENVPWIEVLAVPCDSGKVSPGRFLERTLARQILEVSTPGTYLVRVGAVDSGRGLESYALSIQLSAESRPISKTGESGSDDDTDDSNNEIVPFIYDGSGGADPSCENGLMLCARALDFNTAAEGELVGGWAVESFSFTLGRARAVRVESAGVADTLGVLYDASGHRLLVADDGGKGENFAFTVQLPPGRYFVRVEGAMGSAGVYRLMLSGSDL